MKFYDMSLLEFSEWCANMICDNCPFDNTECGIYGIVPKTLRDSPIMDMEVPESGEE